MVDILVRPVELRQISEQLRASSKKVGAALQAIDNDILALKGDMFLGNRANAVQSHYAPKREALLKASEIVAKFAGDLNTAAMRFEKADRQDTKLDTVTREGAISNNLQILESKWKEMDLDKRKSWLKDWYVNLCKTLGITPVEFKVKDLFDPPGKDARGVYNNGIWFGWFRSLSIDVDNVKGENVREILTTIAHETQHQYQHFLVENPDKRPDHISKEQIGEWADNLKNYVRPEDDYEGYRKQPVEQNARDSADQIVNDHLAQGVSVI